MVAAVVVVVSNLSDGMGTKKGWNYYQCPVALTYIGNHMNVSAIQDLHYEWYSKILTKLYNPLGKWNLKELLNIKNNGSVN